MLEVGLSLDPKLVAAAVAAHANAIEGAGDDPGLVASKDDCPGCVRDIR